MKARPARLLTDHEAFLPYRHLAIQVIDRALRDVTSSTGSMADRESARLFFADSTMLVYWCRVAALDPHSMAERVAKLRRDPTIATM